MAGEIPSAAEKSPTLMPSLYITSSSDNTTGDAYTYRNNKAGSFVFSTSAGTYMYLSGGTTHDVYERAYDYTETGYYIYSGTRYLSYSETSLESGTATDANIWTLSNAPGSTSTTISMKYNNRTYYLYYSSVGSVD